MANPLTLLYVTLKDGVPSIVLHVHFPAELLELVWILLFSWHLIAQTNLVPGTVGCPIQSIMHTTTLIAPILLRVFWLPHHVLNALKIMELGLKNLWKKPKANAKRSHVSTGHSILLVLLGNLFLASRLRKSRWFVQRLLLLRKRHWSLSDFFAFLLFLQ